MSDGCCNGYVRMGFSVSLKNFTILICLFGLHHFYWEVLHGSSEDFSRPAVVSSLWFLFHSVLPGVCQLSSGIYQPNPSWTWQRRVEIPNDMCYPGFRGYKLLLLLLLQFCPIPILVFLCPQGRFVWDRDRCPPVSVTLWTLISLWVPVKKVSPTECNYKVRDRELLAIILALNEQRPLLEGSAAPVLILTDHKNMTYLRGQKDHTPSGQMGLIPVLF